MEKTKELINLQQEVVNAKYGLNYNLGRLDAYNSKTEPAKPNNEAYMDGWKEGQYHLEKEYKKLTKI